MNFLNGPVIALFIASNSGQESKVVPVVQLGVVGAIQKSSLHPHLEGASGFIWNHSQNSHIKGVFTLAYVASNDNKWIEPGALLGIGFGHDIKFCVNGVIVTKPHNVLLYGGGAGIEFLLPGTSHIFFETTPIVLFKELTHPEWILSVSIGLENP